MMKKRVEFGGKLSVPVEVIEDILAGRDSNSAAKGIACEASEPKDAKEQLWAWAEDELRRVQSSLQRTRERLFKVEEDLERSIRDRDWVEDRRRRAEEEAQRLREEVRILERQLRSAEGNGGTAPRFGKTSPDQCATLLQAPEDLPQGQGIDWGDALARVDGDLGFLRAIAEVLAADMPNMLGNLRKADEHGDVQLMERHAREIKAAVKSVGAVAAAQIASRLEAVARSGNLADAQEIYALLPLEIAKLEPALSALRKLS